MMISARNFAFVASVAMFSLSTLAPVMGQPARHQTAAEVQGFRICDAEMLRPDCNLVVMASAKDDDWTASGGALRGLNK